MPRIRLDFSLLSGVMISVQPILSIFVELKTDSDCFVIVSLPWYALALRRVPLNIFHLFFSRFHYSVPVSLSGPARLLGVLGLYPPTWWVNPNGLVRFFHVSA